MKTNVEEEIERKKEESGMLGTKQKKCIQKTHSLTTIERASARPTALSVRTDYNFKMNLLTRLTDCDVGIKGNLTVSQVSIRLGIHPFIKPLNRTSSHGQPIR